MRQFNGSIIRLATFAAFALLVAACATTPPHNAEIEDARATIQRVEELPLAGEVAVQELQAAHASLRDAEELARKDHSKAAISNAAYLARRHADIAEQQIENARAERAVTDAQKERDVIIARARQREAELRAQQTAVAAQLNAERRVQQAENRAENAEAAANQRVQELQQQLADMKPKNTDRGLVLTLGDVLFDSGKATLKPGAVPKVDRLATYLKRAPENSVTIEGHTDNVGSDEYNQELSQRRADAVREALISRGVDEDHIQAVGKGKGFPVASNNSPGGRQQNRRVEVVINESPQS